MDEHGKAGAGERSLYDNVDYRDRGILWLRWDEATQDFIADKGRPVFVFVASQDPLIRPVLSALLHAMPRNDKLRVLLHEQFPALFLEADAIPEHLESLGAGSSYHVAVLSPAGLTPLAVIDPFSRDPDELVETIAQVLERLVGIWP